MYRCHNFFSDVLNQIFCHKLNFHYDIHLEIDPNQISNGAKLGGAGGSGAPADFLVSVSKSREFGCFVVS